MQYRCLKVVLHAIKSTALACLQVEACNPPYHLRRDMLLARHQLKLEGLDSPHPTIISIRNDNKFKFNIGKAPKIFKSYYTTLQNVKNLFQMADVSTKTAEFPDIPPWTIKRPLIDLGLHNIVNKSMVTEDIIEPARNFIAGFTGIHIYTDGSKCPITQKCACSFVIPDEDVTNNFRLSNNISIMSAELMAIKLTLEFINNSDINDCTIFVDSMSSLQAIQGPLHGIENYIILDILKLVTISNCNIKLVWVPSHVGIHGNDMADEGAKSALSHIKDNITVHLNKTETKNFLNSRMQICWQQSWDTAKTGRNMYNTVPKVTTSVKTIKFLGNRLITAYTRLRLGTAGLNHTLYKMKVHENGLCDVCKTPETVEHYLFHCSKFYLQRQKLLRDIDIDINNINISDLFAASGQATTAVMKYIASTRMTKKL